MALVSVMLCAFGSHAIEPAVKEETKVRNHIVDTAESQLHVREVKNNSGPDVKRYLLVPPF